MILAIAAALALTADLTPGVPGAPIASDLTYAMPIAGDWTYAATAGGSEATFSDSAGRPQLTLRCMRGTRRVAIMKTAGAASPSLWVWTSSQSKILPATYDASTARVSAELAAWDPLLDAMAFSRGRIGVSSSGLAALVAPPWGEVGRVVEDCRV
jgi:hypothetical protein